MSEKYDEILQTAYQCFAENGFEKTSMNQIAKQAGITKPAVYYYFVSKEQLIRTLFQVIKAEIDFSEFFNIEAYSKSDFKERLLEDGLAMIKQQREDLFYEKIMREYDVLGSRDASYREELRQILDHYLEGFVSLLHMAAKYELISEEEIEIKAQFLTLVVDSLDKYTEEDYNFNPEAIWKFSVHCIFKER